ncbi:MAG: 1,4-dihydroxy-6-naphthoate synthase [Bacteroidia bacterium]|nr:1,4-dihydroxy-6-naphthoate synthase [Bacteroidia bacterium]
MKLTLGFSPCPNDCFIFDAMVHGKIDTEGLEFDVVMEDVEALNQRAFKSELDITKLSFHAFLYVQENYILLKSGSALGFNCGPLLVQVSKFNVQSLDEARIAIPGKNTTANFLLSLAYPNAKNKIEVLFSEIEQGVLDGKYDAGLIIHESRFTYEQKGLKKIIDLGEFWESLIHAPIPLGGIVARRSFDNELLQKINRIIRKSVEYAYANTPDVMPYVKQHAQEMSEEVMKKHIGLYVNEYSINLGETGEKAVNLLFNKAKEIGLIKGFTEPYIIA